MFSKGFLLLFLAISLIFISNFGCEKGTNSPNKNSGDDQIFNSLEARKCSPVLETQPAEIVAVEVGEDFLEFWPYTGEDFSGTPQDPINLIFYGKADPRDIMSALMSLDGDRTALGFPDEPPFNNTWTDAIGDVQTGYSITDGWTGGAMQLACGDYGPARFHIRLFRMGDWTVANAHFEILIEGTTDHQVISWELAEQFVLADFMRSGLLDETVPIISTAQINQAPFRTIPAFIYNSLPDAIKMLAGGPMGSVSGDVPIITDGHAVILNLTEGVEWQEDNRTQDLVIDFNQVIPKPFCSAGSDDYVFVQGPVYLKQTVRMTKWGYYYMDFRAYGELTVTPVNPLTGEPLAEPYTAKVRERHEAMLSNKRCNASSMLFQILKPMSLPGSGWIYKRLRIDNYGQNIFLSLDHCSDK